MKHYTTIFCCLVLSAILIFVPNAQAATVTHNISMPTSARCVLVNQYIPPYDSTDNPIGDYALYTYEFSFDVVGILSGGIDSYINGVATSSITISYNVPSGYTLQAIPYSYSSSNSENYYNVINAGTGLSTNTIYARTVFCNFFTSINVFNIATIYGQVTLSKTITPNNLPDPPQYITISISGSTSSNLSGSVNPTQTSLVQEVAQAIISAVSSNDTPFPDILTALEDIRTQDQTAYTQIVAYLSYNDTFNSTLYTWLTTVLEDNFTDLLDDTTYISSVLNAARNLINSMNSRDSLYYPIFESALDLANTRLQTLINLMSETPVEAASMENAINQMESKQAAINDYSFPAAGNIMGNANSYVSQGTAGMNLLATILNQPLYILILMTVISLAFVSYLLYGKGV